MNNVSVIENGQQVNIDLIAYFNSNNKKYLFYTKNESVQDGLIKMYVASENAGINASITDEEWTNLKKIMQDIIMGNSKVNFIGYNNTVTLNEPKAIALKNDNINTIRNTYQSKVSDNVSGSTNKDLLSQSFNTEVKAPDVEQVQISSIPNVQNNFNMESTPVNLDTAIQGPSSIDNNTNDNTFNSVPSIEPIDTSNDASPIPDLNIPSVEAEPLTINNVKPAISESDNNIGIDSGFKVSNEPNIFDQPVIDTPLSSDINPFSITEDEVNKPINVTHEVVNNKPLEDSNIFPINNLQHNDKKSGNNDFIVNEKIELNNRKIKLFEELANIYKEENQLLKNENNDNLELTASDLFNNNGTLNESKVLEN